MLKLYILKYYWFFKNILFLRCPSNFIWNLTMLFWGRTLVHNNILLFVLGAQVLLAHSLAFETRPRHSSLLCSLPAVRMIHVSHPPPRFHIVQQELPRFWQELPCFWVPQVHLVRQELPCFLRVLKRVQVVLSYLVDRDSDLHLSPTSCLLNSVINPPIRPVILTHLDFLSLDARTKRFGQEKSHNDISRFRSQ